MAGKRKEAREYFAGILNAALVENQDLVSLVSGHQLADAGGRSPFVVATLAGSERKPLTFRGGRLTIYLNILVFVLYASADGIWTAENSEDALDEIEEAIAGVVDNNQVSAYWGAITYDGRTSPDMVTIAGEAFRVETISLRFD